MNITKVVKRRIANMETMSKTVIKGKVKLLPEEIFAIYQECTIPGAPIKSILSRYGMHPWELAVIRKRIKEAALEALANPRPKGKKKTMVPIEDLHQVYRELSATKDALATVGYELSLLKKRTNWV